MGYICCVSKYKTGYHFSKIEKSKSSIPCLNFLQTKFNVKNGLKLFHEKTLKLVIHAEFVPNILLS